MYFIDGILLTETPWFVHLKIPRQGFRAQNCWLLKRLLQFCKIFTQTQALENRWVKNRAQKPFLVLVLCSLHDFMALFGNILSRSVYLAHERAEFFASSVRWTQPSVAFSMLNMQNLSWVNPQLSYHFFSGVGGLIFRFSDLGTFHPSQKGCIYQTLICDWPKNCALEPTLSDRRSRGALHFGQKTWWLHVRLTSCRWSAHLDALSLADDLARCRFYSSKRA